MEWRERERERAEGDHKLTEHSDHNKDSKTNTNQGRCMRSCPCFCVHMVRRGGAEKDQHFEISPFAQASF